MGGARLAGAKNWSEAGQRMDCRLRYVFQMFTLAFRSFLRDFYLCARNTTEEADNINSKCIAVGLLDFGFVFSTVLMTAGNVSLPFRWSD